MDIVFLMTAFGSGLIASHFGFPPLIGYLLSGFVLNWAGFAPADILDQLADLGILTLLFLIGLKIRPEQLLKREIWLGAASHMVLFIIIGTSFLLALGSTGLAFFETIDMETAALVAFGLSFSSTVVAIKVLEDSGELKSRHGQLAMGILVIQDIVAVGFLTLSSGKMPELWAVSLILLPFGRPLFFRLMQLCGHGELMPLSGLFFAFCGGALFEAAGLKAGLGALVFGMLVAGAHKAPELGRSLMDIKDLFLICFFLSIGFTAIPTWDMAIAAVVLLLLLPIKGLMFFFLLSRFRLRGRTAFLCTLCLKNYSEFCLIVSVVAVDTGLMAESWLVVMALALAISFVFSTVLSQGSHDMYNRWKDKIKRFESTKVLPEDKTYQPKGARALIIGMGRVGTGAYDMARKFYDGHVWGIDSNERQVEFHQNIQRNVTKGDAEDADFWDGMNLSRLQLIMIAVPSVRDATNIYRQLRYSGYKGKTSALVKYDDDRDLLIEEGIDVVFNLYAGAGVGLAGETFAHLATE